MKAISSLKAVMAFFEWRSSRDTPGLSSVASRQRTRWQPVASSTLHVNPNTSLELTIGLCLHAFPAWCSSVPLSPLVVLPLLQNRQKIIKQNCLSSSCETLHIEPPIHEDIASNLDYRALPGSA